MEPEILGGVWERCREAAPRWAGTFRTPWLRDVRQGKARNSSVLAEVMIRADCFRAAAEIEESHRAWQLRRLRERFPGASSRCCRHTEGRARPGCPSAPGDGSGACACRSRDQPQHRAHFGNAVKLFSVLISFENPTFPKLHPATSFTNPLLSCLKLTPLYFRNRLF